MLAPEHANNWSQLRVTNSELHVNVILSLSRCGHADHRARTLKALQDMSEARGVQALGALANQRLDYERELLGKFTLLLNAKKAELREMYRKLQELEYKLKAHSVEIAPKPHAPAAPVAKATSVAKAKKRRKVSGSQGGTAAEDGSLEAVIGDSPASYEDAGHLSSRSTAVSGSETE